MEGNRKVIEGEEIDPLENISSEQATAILQAVLKVPMSWHFYVKTIYAPYTLFLLMQKSGMKFDPAPEPYNDYDFSMYYAGVIMTKRIVEVAYLIQKDPEKIKILKKRFDELNDQQKAVAIEIEVRSIAGGAMAAIKDSKEN